MNFEGKENEPVNSTLNSELNDANVIADNVLMSTRRQEPEFISSEDQKQFLGEETNRTTYQGQVDRSIGRRY